MVFVNDSKSKYSIGGVDGYQNCIFVLGQSFFDAIQHVENLFNYYSISVMSTFFFNNKLKFNTASISFFCKYLSFHLSWWKNCKVFDSIYY